MRSPIDLGDDFRLIDRQVGGRLAMSVDSGLVRPVLIQNEDLGVVLRMIDFKTNAARLGS